MNLEGHYHDGWTPSMIRDDVALEAVTRRPIADSTSSVFVIADNVSLRCSLALLIRKAGCEPETFASAEEFLCQPRDTVPCALIVDLMLSGVSGLELQERLAGRADLPIIFINGHNDVPMAVQAMKAGAVEFLTNPVNDVALLHAIDTAIERSRAALGRESQRRMLRKRYSSLSRREREVMALVVSGLLNKQIGGELGITEITMKAHRGRMMRKMEALSLPDLVRMAAQLGPRHLRANRETPWA